MTRSTLFVLFALFLPFGSTQAGQEKTSQQININNHSPECPDIRLYREVPDGERLGALTLQDDPLYLSKHYCFGYRKIGVNMENYDQPIRYSFKETLNLFKRYHATYKTLDTDEEKIAFTHLYFKALTQQSTVLAKIGQASRFGIKQLGFTNSPNHRRTSLLALNDKSTNRRDSSPIGMIPLPTSLLTIMQSPLYSLSAVIKSPRCTIKSSAQYSHDQ